MNFSMSAALLPVIESYAADLRRIGPDRPPAPRWDQDWFPRLDAAAAYAMVRSLRPKRIVEVGSGHSTRFLARAAADGAIDTRITAIDPAPRASIEGLPVEFLQGTVQQAGMKPFRGLGVGDIVFIDSSHQLKPGSDVEFLTEAALPSLQQGTRVHFHDVFLPDDYPAGWAWRRYNEHDAVVKLLARGFTAEFSSHWVATRMPDRIRGVLASLPLVPGAHESSLWLTKN